MTTDVSIRLRLIDDATKGFKRLEQQTHIIQQHMREESRKAAEEAARASEQSNERIRRGFSQLEQQTRAIQERMAANARRAAEESVRAARTEQDAHIRAYQHINEARERLNVRSHAQIRDDISRTRAAYQTLAQSGVSSFREQVQAAERMRTTIRGLTNEMGHLTNAQRTHGALRFGAGLAGGVGGGVVGTGLAMRAPVTNALELERHLADIVNTAYPERDPRGRLMTIGFMSEVVHKTVKDTGIKLDGAVTLLDNLVASGMMSIQQVIDSLPLAARTVVANRADPLAVAASISKLTGGHTVKNDKELRIAQNMMVAAGQAGGNEYRFLSQYLPKQLAEGSGSGLMGLSGLRKILIMDEAAMLTAGSPEQANINVDNLLSKINAYDTANHLRKMGRGDLSAYLMRRNVQGVDSVTAILEIIQDEMRRDKVLKNYIAKLKKSKDPRNINDTVNALSAIGIGRVITELVPDRQARGALYSMLNTEYTDKVAAAIDKAMVDRNGPNERNFETIQGTTSFKLDALNNAVDASQKTLIDENLTPNIKKTADKMNNFSEEYPGIFKYLSMVPWAAGGITGSTIGQAAMAGGAGWWLKSMFGGGAAATGAAEGAASSSIAAGATALLSRASLAAASATTQASLLLARLPAIGQAAATYAAPYMPLVARGTVLGGAAYAGYQVGPSVDYAIGKALMGNETKLSTALGSALYDFMNYTPEPVEIKPIQVDTNSSLTISLAPGLVVTSQKSATTSNAPSGQNTSKVSTGNIREGAP